ncbi:MAG: hypothetical protein SPL08_01020 [Pseudomonadota bacterium]|nr:hypothetical protein [Pseudomonadota bacterium]
MTQQNKIKSMLLSLAMVGAMLSGSIGGCRPKEMSDERTQMSATNTVQTMKPQRISFPSGAGVLCQGKQVILIPNIYENREQYEKRLKDINAYSKETGYTFITIIDSENKMIYDAAMMEMYPRVHNKMYNMLNNPVSSWASMQIGGGNFVARYTPADILKAMAATRERGMALQ